jgi:class 3 adenylate cyclase/response regulator of citrate/malate metabolism
MSARYKILIVDDEDDVEQLVRQKFRRQVRAQEYEFLFARNGVEALRLLEQDPDVDMAFSDINMPQMDGLTLLERIGENHPLLRTVIISAYGDMDNIRLSMNRGAFDFICKPFDFDDFERTLQKTLRSVEQTKNTIQAIRENNILKMYVDHGVLEFMCCKEFEQSLLANKTIQATVMFIDICGFTSIAEQETPDVVVQLLNQYFDAIVQEIIAFGGTVDKFMGDAVMAVFQGADHLARCTRAALALRRRISDFAAPLANHPDYVPMVSVGINSGEMVSGNIGSASLKRLDYTVIGDVVNLAQRLQAAARPGQILVAEVCATALQPDFALEAFGEMRFKNKTLPQQVYNIGEPENQQINTSAH